MSEEEALKIINSLKGLLSELETAINKAAPLKPPPPFEPSSQFAHLFDEDGKVK